MCLLRLLLLFFLTNILSQFSALRNVSFFIDVVRTLLSTKAVNKKQCGTKNKVIGNNFFFTKCTKSNIRKQQPRKHPPSDA